MISASNRKTREPYPKIGVGLPVVDIILCLGWGCNCRISRLWLGYTSNRTFLVTATQTQRVAPLLGVGNAGSGRGYASVCETNENNIAPAASWVACLCGASGRPTTELARGVPRDSGVMHDAHRESCHCRKLRAAARCLAGSAAVPSHVRQSAGNGYIPMSPEKSSTIAAPGTGRHAGIQEANA
jgi:hypothetical protein